MKKLARALGRYVKRIFALEPLVCISGLSSAVVIVATHFGIILHHSQVEAVVALLVSALVGRRFVVPQNKPKS